MTDITRSMDTKAVKRMAAESLLEKYVRAISHAADHGDNYAGPTQEQVETAEKERDALKVLVIDAMSDARTNALMEMYCASQSAEVKDLTKRNEVLDKRLSDIERICGGFPPKGK